MQGTKGDDLEYGDGEALLYPMMHERPELRWAFIRKVYSIVAVQLLMTVAVASVMVKMKAISMFLATTREGRYLCVSIIVLEIVVIFLLYCYSEIHPVNYILLGVYTLILSFAVGMSCAFTDGAAILEAAILTAVVVVGLTLYTFWAAKRGHDFLFLGPFLYTSLLVLIVFGFIQIFFPMGKIATMIYSALGAILFSAHIIFDTDNLIKRYTYDQYIWASVALYLDILNFFISLLRMLRVV